MKVLGMSRPRRFTVDEALRQLMEEGDDDFQGIEGAMEEDSGETSGEDDSSEQRMWGSGTREFLPLMDDISSSEDDWEEAHPSIDGWTTVRPLPGTVVCNRRRALTMRKTVEVLAFMIKVLQEVCVAFDRIV